VSRKAQTRAIAAWALTGLSSFALLDTDASAAALHGLGCPCPESPPSWIAYPDSVRGAPDFFRKSSIQVQEVVLCERGVHFLFRSKQAAKMRETCLFIGEPTLDQSLQRLPADSIPSDIDFERMTERLEADRSVFAERMKSLRSILRQPANGNHRVVFKTGWFRNAPRVYPSAPIKFRWNGQSVELPGVLDVYFRE